MSGGHHSHESQEEMEHRAEAGLAQTGHTGGAGLGQSPGADEPSTSSHIFMTQTPKTATVNLGGLGQILPGSQTLTS